MSLKTDQLCEHCIGNYWRSIQNSNKSHNTFNSRIIGLKRHRIDANADKVRLTAHTFFQAEKKIRNPRSKLYFIQIYVV